MKHAYLPILAVSALLLSVGSGSAASRNSRRKQREKPAAEHPESAQQQQTQVVPLSSFQAEQAALLEAIRAIQKQAETQRQQAQANQETYASPAIRIQIGLLVVGAIYSLLAGWQLVVIRRQSKILKDTTVASATSAAAALESAQAAKMALHADRPLIIVREIIMTVVPDGHNFTAVATFRNYGHSPAILIDVYLGLETKRGDEVPSLTKGNLQQYTRHSIQKQVLGDGEDLSEMITTKFVAPQIFREILNRETVQVAHGLVRYRGTFELSQPYESRFCWFYLPPYDGMPNGLFVIGPKELNTTT